ncbi:MAG: helix-turn-helix domain-containing protein [Reichenbachiella sp.]|uniref:helix-turn-helix domain-containing protein n=1 Tax=Reichenbachiella sp. TaxID=2184521 RepID=UPI003296A700
MKYYIIVLMIVVNIVGASVLCIMLLFVITKKGKNTNDYWLIAVIGLLASYFVIDLWIRQGLTHTNLIIRSLLTPYLFASFLTYAALLLDEGHQLRKEWWWFGLYAVIWNIFLLTDFCLSDYTLVDLNEIYNTPPVPYKIFLLAHDVFNVGALFWLLSKTKAYDHTLKNNYSDIAQVNLLWLKNFIWIYLILKFTAFIAWGALSLEIATSIEDIRPIFNVWFVILMVYLSYHGIRQYAVAEFFDYDPVNRSVVLKSDKPGQKYQSSTLSDEDLNQLQTQINRLFEDESLHLNAELKVHHLAEKLEVTTHKISQTLNSKAGITFYDYVNQYRVEHFKKLLTDPKKQNFTILGLGFDSGFNSKASMNRIFKQLTGLTPKEYKSQFSASKEKATKG